MVNKTAKIQSASFVIQNILAKQKKISQLHTLAGQVQCFIRIIYTFAINIPIIHNS